MHACAHVSDSVLYSLTQMLTSCMVHAWQIWLGTDPDNRVARRCLLILMPLNEVSGMMFGMFQSV